MNKTSRYAMFALLYFAQGSIMAYFTALNALYLQSFGLGMGKVGIIGTIALIPFVIKIFLGILSDKVNFFGLGFRKPYIILGLFIQAVCLLVVPVLDPGQHFMMYALLAFVMMMGMALYDTCTDGLALDSTPVEEEGIIQGFMVGGRAAGMVITSALLGLTVQHISWSAGFILLAVITLLPLPLVLKNKETERVASAHFEWSAFRSFKQPYVIALGVLGALYSLIINGANQLVNPFLVYRFSINFSTAGYVSTVLGLGIMAGGLIGGSITDQIGQKRSVQIAIVASLIGVGLLPFVVTKWLGWLLVFIFGFSFGFYETIYFAISMRITDGRIAATMFSILMAVANIGTGIGLALSGFLSDLIGFKDAFFILAALNFLALPLVRVIFGRNKKDRVTLQME
ncbi:MAG: MFS transporter [Anaerolineaceae bacterium]|nr:MFS transporter [Anaerolineaceae bacterium]